MARRAKGRLSPSIKKALQQQKESSQPSQNTAEPIPPFRSGNPAIMPKLEVIQKPTAIVLYNDPDEYKKVVEKSYQAPRRALPSRSKRKALSASSRAEAFELMQDMSKQTLIGKNPAGGNEFWIDLHEEILGGLRIRITMEGKRLSALLFAPTDTIALILEQRVDELENLIRKKGLKVDKFEVVVGSQKK